jgi:hypothetical protein
MALNTASQEAVPMAVGVTYVAFLTSFPPEAVLGSFTGAVIFLLGASNKPKWQWVLLFSLAFMAGLLGAKSVSEVFAGLLGLVGLKIPVSMGLGAMFSASCVINVAIWFRDNPTALFKRFTSKEEKPQ